MIDVVGYFAVATNVFANYLLARKHLAAWWWRIGSILLWGIYAVGAASWPQLANSIAFLGINLYGLWFWQRARGHDEHCRGRRPCSCGKFA